MNCARVRKLLSAFLDGELSGHEMITIRSHVCSCRECDNELEAIRRTRELIARGPELETPAGLEDRLLTQVFRHDALPSNRPRLLWGGGLALAAIAGSILAITIVRDARTKEAEARATLELRTQEMARDQAYFDGMDPLAGGNGLIPVSYGQQ